MAVIGSLAIVAALGGLAACDSSTDEGSTDTGAVGVDASTANDVSTAGDVPSVPDIMAADGPPDVAVPDAALPDSGPADLPPGPDVPPAPDVPGDDVPPPQDVPPAPYCGDGACNPDESTANCQEDCGTSCGDAACNGGESSVNCADDCGTVCGDAVCNGAETSATCSDDCGSLCGDSTCNGAESSVSCPGDCGSVCGDGACNLSEGSATCADDCGPQCGDTVCNGGETPQSCGADCTTTCGDASCEAPETTATCPADCGTACGDAVCNGAETTATCADDCGSSCGDGTCNGAETTAACSADCGAECGDDTCNGDETSASCPADCGAQCGDGTCNGDETLATCAADCAECGDATCSPGETPQGCPADCSDDDGCPDEVFLDLANAPGAGPDYPAPELEAWCEDGKLIVESNGIPHYTFVPLTPNALVAQNNHWEIPLDPQLAAAPTDIPLLGIAGFSVAGLVWFGPNEGQFPDPYGDPVYNAIVDGCLGHTAQEYHLHALNQQCLTQEGVTATPWTGPAPDPTVPSPILGFALDGFPIYGPYGCMDAECAQVVEFKSGWDQTGDPTTYAWDNHEWTPKVDPTYLDKCNGRSGPDGTYRYHATATFPYILGCYMGTPMAQNGGTDPGGGPVSCTQESDCTLDKCFDGSQGCTCHTTPQNNMICASTCSTAADCPALPDGGAMNCAPAGVCVPQGGGPGGP